MNRKNLLKTLSDPVKDLLFLLYHSEKEFISVTEPVALEDLLISYDHVIGNDIYVKKIAGSIFLNIPPRVDPDLYFLTTIETFLLSREQINSPDPIANCREEISEINPKVTKELERLLFTPSPQ